MTENTYFCHNIMGSLKFCTTSPMCIRYLTEIQTDKDVKINMCKKLD